MLLHVISNFKFLLPSEIMYIMQGMISCRLYNLSFLDILEKSVIIKFLFFFFARDVTYGILAIISFGFVLICLKVGGNTCLCKVLIMYVSVLTNSFSLFKRSVFLCFILDIFYYILLHFI